MTVKDWDTRSKDGLKLHGKYWLPESAPSHIICLIHGHGEHIGRYEHVAAFFTEHNIAFFAMDMRGHGQSEGKRGHIPSYEMIFSDIEELIKRARIDYLETPIILYGHSLGGNFAANYIIHNKTNEIESLIISSPWLRLAFEPPAAKVNLARTMRRIWPSYSEHSKLDAQGLSHDQAVVKAYQEDPLVHDKISVSLFTRAIQYGEYAINHAPAISIPALLMHGEEDPITSIEASKAFVDKGKAHGLPVTFQSWPTMKHEPHNELEKQKVLDFIADWILKKQSLSFKPKS